MACGDPAKARALLSGLAGVEAGAVDEGGRLFVKCASDRFSQVNAALVGGGLPVAELSPVRQSLEEIFLAQ